MSRPKTVAFAFIAVALAAVVLRLTLFGDSTSDRDQIVSALNESIEAGKEGRSGSIVDLLSAQFEVNGYQPGSREVSRMVKEFKPDVEVMDPEPIISGDSAEMNSPVKLKLTFPVAKSFQIDDVKFTFEREPATTMLIFPAKKWRLRSVQLPADAMAQLGDLSFGSGLGLLGR